MRSVWGWLAALALAACTGPTPGAGKPPALGLTPVAFSVVPGWQQDHLSDAMTALRRECTVLATLPADTALGGESPATHPGGRAGDWRPLCTAIATVAPGDNVGARATLERALQPYAISDNGQAEGLFTGYYEPEVAGALHRGGRYQTPLLRRPGDLVQADLGQFATDLKGHTIEGRVSGAHLVPYYDRADIESGTLDRQKLALMYLADPIDAFFLQIQGSGIVKLNDGKTLRLAYAAKNGRPYTPIGRVLIANGALDRKNVSLQTIRAWLNAHPSAAKGVMEADESFVFFELAPLGDPALGSPGTEGVPLTPMASLAIDERFHPFGAPIYIATMIPDPDAAKPDQNFQRLLIAQDTGGAIKGAARGDIFFGPGAKAEAIAGRLNAHGQFFVLIPKAAATALGSGKDFPDAP